MAEHNLSWDQVVQMCHQAHPEDEYLVVNVFQAEQLDLEATEVEAEVAEAEAEAVERAQGRERLAAARAEIADTRAELAEARAELAEAHAAMAAPPVEAIIHDIVDDDVVPSRFECVDNQQVLLASFETLGTPCAAADAEAATAKAEAASSLARRILWDSSLAEALERRMRQDEVSDHRLARRAEGVKRSRFDDGAGPSGGQ
ncbi:hypothetical protein QYE76_043444 [Lolium multiflorum]|uniref:Uncharacterized protein n=1 Tax=Lolium multiflorum TaxID=4521 RepID=A0AAD8THE8_LOLMU|nr:hypothetical protein QYE76_043444 [Lolium multiflorum]